MATGHDKIRLMIEEYLSPDLNGVEIVVESNPRWKKPVVQVVWRGFEGMLPEQRFRAILELIPRRVYQDSLGGFYWFEMTPDETVDNYLKLPRSEDIGNRREALYREIKRLGFFEKFSDLPEMSGTSAGARKKKPAMLSFAKLCEGLRFTAARQVFADLDCKADKIEPYCLCLISMGATTDRDIMNLLTEA